MNGKEEVLEEECSKNSFQRTCYRTPLNSIVSRENLMMTIDIKWFPPSWVQVKASKKIIYIDPAYLKKYYTSYPKKIEFSSWPDPIDGLPEKDLERADIILVTHHHKDHCKNVTVNRLRKQQTSVIAAKSCVKELGKNITVIGADKEVEIHEVLIRAVEAYNRENNAKTKVAHKKGIGVGYVISIEGKSIYHAGDTDLIPEMEHLGEIDVAFLPIGDRGFTMNLTEAVQAAIKIRPKVVVPMHSFDASPQEFKKQVENRSAIKVVPLQIGEMYRLR